MPTILLGYIACFGIGLLLGILGGGGSILAIPVLIYLFQLDVVEATAYSLFIVGSTSLVGAYQRYRLSAIDLQAVWAFGLPSIISVFITRFWLLPAIPDLLLLTDQFIITKRSLMLGLYSLAVITAAVLMITRSTKPLTDTTKGPDEHLFFYGLAIGCFTGLIGLGGGFLILPVLFFIRKLPFAESVGTTLTIISLKSLIGFLGDLATQPINWPLLVSISSISIVGMLVGTRVTKFFASSFLKVAFGWFILALGLTVLIREALNI